MLAITGGFLQSWQTTASGMIRIRKISIVAVALGLALTFSSRSAFANIALDATPTITGPVGTTFTWTYGTALGPGETLLSGSFFTLYDFAGLQPGTVTPPSLSGPWTITVQNVGITPATTPGSLAAGLDDASLPNATWTYTGATVVNSGDTAIDLGTVSLGSTFNLTAAGIFAGSDQNNAGAPVTDIGTTRVPAAPVPEPTTMVLLGIGSLGVFAARILKRK